MIRNVIRIACKTVRNDTKSASSARWCPPKEKTRNLFPGRGLRSRAGETRTRNQRIMSPEPDLHNVLSLQEFALTDNLTLQAGLQESPENDPNFTRVATAWPNLPDETKMAILRLIDAD